MIYLREKKAKGLCFHRDSSSVYVHYILWCSRRSIQDIVESLVGKGVTKGMGVLLGLVCYGLGVVTCWGIMRMRIGREVWRDE